MTVTITYTAEVPVSKKLKDADFQALLDALHGLADKTLVKKGLPSTSSFTGNQVQKLAAKKK